MQTQHKTESSYQPNHHHQFYQLTIPCTPEEVHQLQEQKISYEKMYLVSFLDLGSFISHIVAQQLLEEKEAIHINNLMIYLIVIYLIWFIFWRGWFIRLISWH